MQNQPTGMLPKSIAETQAHFLFLFNSSNAKALAACFSERAQFLPPGCQSIQGRFAIQAFWQGLYDMGVHTLQQVTTHVEAEGNYVYELGNYVLGSKDRRLVDQGQYLVIWKRSGNEWQ